MPQHTLASAPAGDDQDGELPPPGSRWGAGAQSVLPYLTKTLQAKPMHSEHAEQQRPRAGNPVFANWPPRG